VIRTQLSVSWKNLQRLRTKNWLIVFISVKYYSTACICYAGLLFALLFPCAPSSLPNLRLQLGPYVGGGVYEAHYKSASDYSAGDKAKNRSAYMLAFRHSDHLLEL